MMYDEDDIPGRLVAVEGLDGSGKSTQVHLVHQWLLGLGCKVFFSEWNSSEMVKGATRRGKKKQLLTPTTFSLIHATDFADRYVRQILPMLKGGYIVLCDRYVYTSFARDSVRGCDASWLRRLYSFAREPDLVFYFQLPLDMAVSRVLVGRNGPSHFEAGMDLGLSGDIGESFHLFQSRVREEYDRMAVEFGFTLIDGRQPIPVQQETVRSYIAGAFDIARFRSRAPR